MKNLSKFIVASLLCVAGAQAASPDFFVNISSGSFVLNSAPGVPAAANVDIWFVADKTGNGLGIGAPGSSVLDTVVASWLSGSGDDVSVYENFVPGSLPPIPSNNGKFTRNSVTISQSEGVTFSDLRATSPTPGQPTKVWAILWNDSTAGNVGDQFAIQELTIGDIPTVGNATWSFTANMTANQYTVVAVPEPSTYAMMLLGGLGVLGYRRFKK